MIIYSTDTQAFTQKEIEHFNESVANKELSSGDLLIRQAIESYLTYRDQCAANGDMDIDWQTDGLGLYGLSHRLDQVQKEYSREVVESYCAEVMDEMAFLISQNGSNSHAAAIVMADFKEQKKH